jgi:DMSO/TMAO reductase YedYZ molybdopterin-dependent catalytic subunit
MADSRSQKTGPSTDRGIGRRLFLKISGALTFCMCFPSSLRAFFVSRLPVRTVETGSFNFDPLMGQIIWKEKGVREPFRLVLDGLVEKPVSLSYVDLKSFPQISQKSDFHCVEGWSVKDLVWGGFRFAEVLKRVKPKPEARYAIFHSLGQTEPLPNGLDHYIESFPVKDLLDPKKACLLALSMNGKPLPHDHGAPLRLVSPYDLGYKGSKYVTRIEFASEARPGWWTLANPIYPVDAPVPSDRLRKKG